MIDWSTGSRCAYSTAWCLNDANTAHLASTFLTNSPTATYVYVSANSRCSLKSTRKFPSRFVQQTCTDNKEYYVLILLMTELILGISLHTSEMHTNKSSRFKQTTYTSNVLQIFSHFIRVFGLIFMNCIKLKNSDEKFQKFEVKAVRYWINIITVNLSYAFNIWQT